MSKWQGNAGGSPLGSEDGLEPGATAINPIGLPLRELKKLKDRFQDEYGQPKKLNLNEFVEALSTNQPEAESPAQREQWYSEFRTLFKKIDASCNETVNWEEFTNYILNHMPGFQVGDGACELSQNPQGGENFAAAWGCGHQDMINCISVVYDIGPTAGAGTGGAVGGGRRYVTVGRDGYVKVWLPDLRLHREIDVGQHKSWLAACCWMPRSRRLAVASSRFKIYFFDSSFSLTPLSHIDHKDSTPLCLGYTESNESDGREKEILMVGDNNGCVTVYPLDDDWTTKSEQDVGKNMDVKPCKRKYHSDWVTKVGFVEDLQAMVSCGLDGEINLCDVHMNQRKEGRDAIRLHKKGVHSWCWCKSYKFFASGGLDRQIIIWNPYTQKAMNFLQGHNASILDVLVNESQAQLISLSVDKVVKVWDIRNYRCIQTFTDKTEYKPEDRLTCMAFDEEGPALVLCSSTLNVLPVNVKVDTSRTHLAPIMGALYNEDYHQIVSGDNQGTVCVWDVRSGKLEFEFRRTHGDAKLTCMAFDESNRRLYTGGEDGIIRLWNFSSGHHIRPYVMPRPSELTGLLVCREGPNLFVVGLAWDRCIYVWPECKKSPVEVQQVLGDNTGHGHNDDITCICKFSMSNALLATGGDDGYIIFWKIPAETSNAANSSRWRLWDTTPATPANEGLKQGSQDTKSTRKKKPGKNYASTVGQDGDAAAMAAALGGHNAKGEAASSGATAGASSGGGTGKYTTNTRSSVGMPGPRGSDEDPVAGGGAAGTASSTAPKDGAESKHSENEWPEEFVFAEDNANMRSDGVEKLIYLETKEILLSTHSDRKVRVWSIRKSEFIQRLELLEPAPPQEASSSGDRMATEKSGAGDSSSSAPREHMRDAMRGADLGHHGQKTASSSSAAPAASTSERLVNAQEKPITALYTDSQENRWLFTGDAEGKIRVWDLTPLNVCHTGKGPPPVKYLLKLHEFQPHRQPVTHLQHFELDGQIVVMSASLDCTIVLCTIQGERIGTFCSKGPHWRLADKSTWIDTPPLLDDGPRMSEEDDGWGLSPRRPGKGGPGGRHHHGRGAPGAAGAPGGAPGGIRTPRSGQARIVTRTTMAQAGHGGGIGGRGVYRNLKAVDIIKPDLGLYDQENQLLKKHEKNKTFF